MVNHVDISSIRINVWGYMQYGVGAKVFLIDNNFTGKKYLDCLIENLKRSIPDISELIYMQDNCSLHRTPEVIDFFISQKLKVLNHPPCSPDLNPLENCWHLAQRKLNHHLLTNFVNTPEKLFELVKKFVEEIPVSMINYLIDGMPSRIAAVRDCKGGQTRF